MDRAPLRRQSADPIAYREVGGRRHSESGGGPRRAVVRAKRGGRPMRMPELCRASRHPHGTPAIPPPYTPSDAASVQLGIRLLWRRCAVAATWSGWTGRDGSPSFPSWCWISRGRHGKWPSQDTELRCGRSIPVRARCGWMCRSSLASAWWHTESAGPSSAWQCHRRRKSNCQARHPMRLRTGSRW